MGDVSFILAEDDAQLQMVTDFAGQLWNRRLVQVYGSLTAEYAHRTFYTLPALRGRQKEGMQFHLICYLGAMIGYLGVTFRPGVICIDDSYIQEDYHGNRVLGGLVYFLENLCGEYQSAKVRITVDGCNERAVSICEKLGFKLAGVRSHNIHEDWIVENWIMERQL